MITAPRPVANRNPRVSISHAAGSDRGMNASMKTIAKAPMAVSLTP